MGDLTGQVAFVTGGTRGIGLAVSERLAARGMQVAVAYASNDEAAKAFLDRHDGASIHRLDVGDKDACEKAWEDVVREHGRIDVLVNNAGITADKPVKKMSTEDWDKVIQVNLSGSFYLARLAFTHMTDRESGRIVNISSVIGEMGNYGQANYSAAKSGLFGMTMSMALESAKKGVTVNAIAPGYIDTDMVAAVPEEMMAKITKQIPVGRLGKPDEVARVVEFLADPDSAYITGQVFSVNGGLYM